MFGDTSRGGTSSIVTLLFPRSLVVACSCLSIASYASLGLTTIARYVDEIFPSACTPHLVLGQLKQETAQEHQTPQL